MRKSILIPLLLLLTSVSLHSSWFTKDKPAPDNTEREQRIQVEQRLTDAQQQIEAQRQTIQRLYAYTAYVAAGAVILLIVGVAIGSKVRPR